MRKALLAFAVLASVLSAPLTAHADTIDQFTFNFVPPPGFVPAVLTIDLPASPPASYLGGLFGQCPVSDCITVLGHSGSNTYLVNFFQDSPDATFVEYALDNDLSGPLPVIRAYTQISAPNLITGPISAPTFLTGTFDGEYMPVVGFPQFPGTLTIETLNDSTVPEPSTFALMTTGILGAITTFRRRRSMARHQSITPQT
jgi:hypothetical protein